MSESEETGKKRGRPRIHPVKEKTRISGRGVPIRGQSREFVCSLRDYFEKEKEHGGPLISVSQVVDRTAAALSISKNTVVTIGKEKFKQSEEAGPSKLETPGKKRRIEKRVTNLDAFAEDGIRRHVYEYHSRKEYPTIKKLLVTLHDAELFTCSHSSLRSVIKNLGFKFTTVSGRKVLMEQQHVVASRCRLLRGVINENFNNVVWVDETWVNAGHSLKKCWSDDSTAGTMPVRIGKGGRLIIIHAGNSQGFIPNCLYVFKSKKTSDYHEEMNHNKFKTWFEEFLLKNIPPNSVIVMDNAPYHSVIKDKAPTMASKKEEMVEWLKRRNIPLTEDMKKAELMEFVLFDKLKFPVYIVDELAESYGHEVIRLPPYHCHFNAIELIWARVKKYVAINNTKFTMTEVEKLTNEAMQMITGEDWKKVVEHTKSIIEDAWKNEGIVEQQVENLIISVNCSSDSESVESEDSDSTLSGVQPL